MKELYELINLYYDVASTYKKYFYKEKKQKDKKQMSKKERLKMKIESQLNQYYESEYFYSLLSNYKESSLNSIKNELSDQVSALSLIEKIDYTIDRNDILEDIKLIFVLFYDVLGLEECCELVIKKYGDEYKKYCNLYIDMEKLKKDIIQYSKSLKKNEMGGKNE